MPTGTIIAKDIKSRIEQGGRNRIYVISDFADLNNDDAAGRVLSRMAGEGLLIRLAHGLYLYPNKNRFGVQHPSIDTIARTIAEKDKSRIIPSGPSALNAIGLSTQVPMNAVYVTNGTAKQVNVGNRSITFKRGCPRLFSYRSPLFALAVMAMREIGEKKITTGQIEYIEKKLLASPDIDTIKEDYLSAPSWMRKSLNLSRQEVYESKCV